MTSLNALCDDFHVSCYLNTELELPSNRDTVLHYFEQAKKAFPTLTSFQGKEQGEFLLEEEKDDGRYRWFSLEQRRLGSGITNPASVEEVSRVNEVMLDLAPPMLSISPLDCEALDVVYTFDFNFRGNHDEVISEVFLGGSRFEGLFGQPDSPKVIDFEPTITLALDEACKLQCRLGVVTRTNWFQVKNNQFGEDAISIYFTVRQHGGTDAVSNFIGSYRNQMERGLALLEDYVVPTVLVPLAEAISTR